MSDDVAVEVLADEPKPEKHVRGRPRKYASPEEFRYAVDWYEARCIEDEEPLTITGLVLALGFANHSSLYHYGKYEGFEDEASRARMLVEHSWEKRLCGPHVSGPIFALKQFKWTDKPPQDKGDDLSPEEFAQRAAAAIRAMESKTVPDDDDE